MNLIEHNLRKAQQILEQFVSDTINIKAIAVAGKLMVSAIRRNNKIISCGNGGSMADAMHFAEELSGLFRERRPAIAALSISDPSHITCVANDYGFEHIFSRYIEGLGRKGDVLLAISTSGNSPNIINAAKTAHKKAMKVVALTGNGGGKLFRLADCSIIAPSSTYSDRIQEVHIKVIHCLIDYIERNIKR